MNRIQITSREIYAYYLKKIRVSGGCTNRTILEKETGREYSKLRWTFGNKGENYYEDDEVVIIRVMSSSFQKGSQSLKRRGRGGMEKFAQYITRKGD